MLKVLKDWPCDQPAFLAGGFSTSRKQVRAAAPSEPLADIPSAPLAPENGGASEGSSAPAGPTLPAAHLDPNDPVELDEAGSDPTSAEEELPDPLDALFEDYMVPDTPEVAESEPAEPPAPLEQETVVLEPADSSESPPLGPAGPTADLDSSADPELAHRDKQARVGLIAHQEQYPTNDEEYEDYSDECPDLPETPELDPGSCIRDAFRAQSSLVGRRTGIA
jgi:hypothetical protein